MVAVATGVTGELAVMAVVGVVGGDSIVVLSSGHLL